MKFLILAFTLFIGQSAAQTVPGQTTLLNPLSANATQLQVSSAAGIVPGYVLFIDREAMTVVSTFFAQITVTRGASSTHLTPHNAAATVYSGPLSIFYSGDDPSGACSVPTAAFQISPKSGNVATCTSGSWVVTSPLSGGATGAGVASFNTRTGPVSLSALDVTTALTFTPVPANQPTTGNAATATALATLPTLCSGGQLPTGILANGNATGCATPATGAVILPQPGTLQAEYRMTACNGTALTAAASATVPNCANPGTNDAAMGSGSAFPSATVQGLVFPGAGTAPFVNVTPGFSTSTSTLMVCMAVTPAAIGQSVLSIQTTGTSTDKYIYVAPIGSMGNGPVPLSGNLGVTDPTSGEPMAGDHCYMEVFGTGVTNPLIYLDGQETKSYQSIRGAALPLAALTNVFLGKNTLTTATNYAGTIYFAAQWTANLSATDAYNAAAYARNLMATRGVYIPLGNPVAPSLLMIDGDSISAGFGNIGLQTSYLAKLLPFPGDVIDIGVGGNTTSQAVNGFAARAQKLIQAHKRNVVVLHVATNDLTSGAINTAWDQLKLYAKNLKTANPTSLLIFSPVLPRSNGMFEQQRAQFNSLVRTYAANLGVDAVADSDSDYFIGQGGANVDFPRTTATGNGCADITAIPTVPNPGSPFLAPLGSVAVASPGHDCGVAGPSSIVVSCSTANGTPCGSGATLTATMTGTQQVGHVNFTASGTSCTAAPNVTFSGGAGSGASAVALTLVGAYNQPAANLVVAVAMTANGTGYTSAPTATISGSGCSGLGTATPTIGYAVASFTVSAAGTNYFTTAGSGNHPYYFDQTHPGTLGGQILGNYWASAIQNGVNGGTAFVNQTQQRGIYTPYLFAALPPEVDGTTLYCSNCTAANPTAAGGTGVFVVGQNGAWAGK